METCIGWIPEGGRNQHRSPYWMKGRSCRNKQFRRGFCKPCYEHMVRVKLTEWGMWEFFTYAIENDLTPYEKDGK